MATQETAAVPMQRRVSPKPVDQEGENTAWLHAHYDPVASLYTFTSCLALSDLNADGDHKLLVADLGTGRYNMKLKVYKGTALHMESAIVDLPTGVCTFYMDQNEPLIPAVAVASGPFIYIYKNSRPYFKFTTPPLEVNAVETYVWNQVKEGIIDINILKQKLIELKNEVGEHSLTVRSLRLLQLPPEDMDAFVSQHKYMVLKKQTVITCINTLKKTHSEESAISCLVIGTEASHVFILDPQAFTILATMTLPSVPAFMSVGGLFDVEYSIVVSCRDGNIYTLKRGSKTAKYCIELSSQPVGMERVGKNIIVACMDRTLVCYSPKGKKLWTVYLPDDITALELMQHEARGFKAIMVALKNRDVHLYKDKYLVNVLKCEDVVNAMKFGRFGREDGALIMTTKGGGLIIKLLKRTANFEARELAPGAPASQSVKLNIPRKSKVAVDQIHRERANSIEMHQVFQKDLVKLQLEATRGYIKSLHSSLNPVSSSQAEPVKLSARVQGIGPLFKMTVELQNTSSTNSLIKLLIAFRYDDNLYSLSRPLIQVPFLVPSLLYSFETLVQCHSDAGVTDSIKAYLLREGSSVPIISAAINMPVSESVVIV
ncbi:Bardet-Biedl syndrome 1 protein-like [Corticium candelabrum]|uniref:Bardet-Biedl syndrome 1 protein-like n=1 Tax=Corticium candelabrum TaxID=121492 RepID=UPI002E26C4C1|nr:Bardet-Biedl syndrome 1 protein-like [Corticium candelabrum]